jgi:Txe/YoeB family toxin of Txe-Axe toxin-antitoxin module
MKVTFTPKGWDDLCSWIETDRKKLNRIMRLIKEARSLSE